MSDTSSDLEQLRRRIDEIDNRLQDLLTERVDIVSRVAASKRSEGGIAPHQPAREAEILRRLIARNQGSLPAGTLVRMWRELLAATTRQQGPFTVAVYTPPESPGFYDLARDQYGSHTPLLTFRSTGQVIRAVTEGQAVIGVLPMPQEEEQDPWWRHLLSPREDTPHVIARLPFGPRGNARNDGADALAIGHGTPQPTGRDRTLFVTENAADISRGRIFSTLSAGGLTCTFMASWEQGEDAYTLIELDGFVTTSDPRLQGLRDQLGPALSRLLRFGGYAVPLGAAELGSSRPLGGAVSIGVTAAVSAAALAARD